MNAPLALTPGEPAGIGPDICLQAYQQGLLKDVVVYASAKLLQQRAYLLNIQLKLNLCQHPGEALDADALNLYHLDCPALPKLGVPVSDNANYTLNCLRETVRHCTDGTCSGLVTGPVHKAIISESGVSFSGHTEFLRDLCGVDEVLMLFVSPALRLALVTTHIPLQQVSAAITAERLRACLCILHQGLQQRLGIPQPRILVTGLNPHAGEQGYLGDEEQRVIAPVLQGLQEEGMDLQGPLSADTLFVPEKLQSADAVLAMYHDQGLPVLKALSFGEAVNTTLGLPFVRTSVDHGTAFDLAGTGRADPSSLHRALELARELVDD